VENQAGSFISDAFNSPITHVLLMSRIMKIICEIDEAKVFLDFANTECPQAAPEIGEAIAIAHEP
jgi:hypothetical protein